MIFMKNYYIIAVLFVSLIGCSNDDKEKITYYENGRIKSKTFLLDNKNVQHKYFNSERNNIEIVTTYENDTLSSSNFYYSNDNLRKKGVFYLDSLEIGNWNFYDIDGNITDVREFLIINKKSYLNQRWLFNTIGDTIGGNFFEVKFSDTIVKGKPNRFHFLLTRPILSEKSKSFILIPKEEYGLNKDFSNQNDIKYDTVFSIGSKYPLDDNLKTRDYDIVMDVYSKEKGEVNLKGILVEKEIKDGDSIDFVTRNIYFIIPYFIKVKDTVPTRASL